MNRRTLSIEGVGFWAPTLPGWPQASAALRGNAPALPSPAAIPRPGALPSAERRRAPETVSLALAASEAALKASGRQPEEVLAVFTSAHGDLPAIDNLCSTLAQNPLMVSPTRFLHSIHNSPLGVWSLLAGNGRNHSAVTAAECSFAAGFLEAALLAETEQQPVLLVGYDTAATGALVHTTASQGAIAVALVLHPHTSAQTQWALAWHLALSGNATSGPQSETARSLPPNGMSQALPLLEAMALEQPASVSLRLSAYQQLHISLSPRVSRAQDPVPER